MPRKRELGQPWCCPQCKIIKPESEFYEINGRPSSYCRPCYNKVQVESRKKNQERYRRILDANNKWLKGHRELNRQSQMRYRERIRAGGHKAAKAVADQSSDQPAEAR